MFTEVKTGSWRQSNWTEHPGQAWIILPFNTDQNGVLSSGIIVNHSGLCFRKKCIERPFLLRFSEIKLTWSEGSTKEVMRKESRKWVHDSLCNREQNFKGRKVFIRKTHSSVAIGSSQKFSEHLENTQRTPEIVCKPLLSTVANSSYAVFRPLPPPHCFLHQLKNFVSFHSAECCICIYMCVHLHIYRYITIYPFVLF